MNRLTSIALTIGLVAALTAVPLGAAGAFVNGGTDYQNAQDAGDETEAGNDSIAPGERLSGVVGVQESEIDGEVSERTYGVKIANANTDEAKADVVAEQIGDVETRLDELETRLDELNESREAGEISEGEYRSRVAKVAAEKRTVERLAESAEATATELPDDVLADRGIDVEQIRTLRESASELGGEEVSEIGQSIAGENVGNPVADRKPGAPIDAPGDGADRGGDGNDSTDRSDGADEDSSADSDDEDEESSADSDDEESESSDRADAESDDGQDSA